MKRVHSLRSLSRNSLGTAPRKKMTPKLPPIHPKMTPRTPQTHPKMTPRSPQTRPKGEIVSFLLAQPVLDKLGIASAVQDRMYLNRIPGYPIEDGEGEALGDKAVVAKILGMYTATLFQCIDLCLKIIEKVVPKSRALSFVESEPINEVCGSILKNLNIHCVYSRMRRLASVQSINREVPSAMRCSRSFSTCSCHAGTGRSSS